MALFIPDIIDNIFSFENDAGCLFGYALVCKSWYDSAIAHENKNLYVEDLLEDEFEELYPCNFLENVKEITFTGIKLSDGLLLRISKAKFCNLSTMRLLFGDFSSDAVCYILDSIGFPKLSTLDARGNFYLKSLDPCFARYGVVVLVGECT